VRPGIAAAVSLSVSADEQGSAAGLLSGFAVIGNVVGPLLGTAIYEYAPVGAHLLNATIMVAATVYALTSRRIGAIPT